MKDFELALSELIDSYRKHVSKTAIASALSLHSDLVANDETWTQTAKTGPATEKEDETVDQDLGDKSAEEAEKPE